MIVYKWPPFQDIRLYHYRSLFVLFKGAYLRNMRNNLRIMRNSAPWKHFSQKPGRGFWLQL